MESENGSGADEVTSLAPETLKWSRSRCWRLSFRVLSAGVGAAAAVICVTECFRVLAHGMARC